MADEIEIVNYGIWDVPSKWEDIDLGTYQELERFYEGKDESFDIRKVVHILCHKTEDEINSLPIDFLEKIMEKLLFLQEKPTEEEPRNWVDIDGERYTVHTENKLRTGEYIASDTVIKGDRHNYAALMAILCRKDGEVYDSRFENEVLEDRIKLFEKQSVVKILPIISFFLQLYIISMSPTLLSSKVEEAIDLIRKDIETSATNGEISKRSMRSAMKRLKKLEKSINSI